MIQCNFNLNAYQTAIENLISEGYVIVQLIIGGTDVMYFATLEFDPPIHGSVQTVPYGQLKGCKITDHLKEASDIYAAELNARAVGPAKV